MKISLLAFVLVLTALTVQAAERPDFASFKDVKQKKTAFFNYMYAFVEAENKKILEEKNILHTQPRNSAEVKVLCEKYSKNCDIIDDAHFAKLKNRIDVIPPSLALAQSANESAWGTSRFALKGYNYFGQWCYSKGCGLVPSKRNSGASHEVRKFSHGQQSVRAYMINLNTGRAYKDLRRKRAEDRTNGIKPSGIHLAEGLINYSERREHYVKELQSMIRYNKLVDIYDAKFWIATE